MGGGMMTIWRNMFKDTLLILFQSWDNPSKEMKNVGWSFPTIENKLEMKWMNLHGYNNYKVMANLDIATLVAIFPPRIVELPG